MLESLTKALAFTGFAWFGKEDTPDRDYTQVVLHDAVQTGAVCLDGSPPLYYFRPGVGAGASKWHVHHQGGGWCNSLDDCLARSMSALGSSLYEVNTFGENRSAYFSTDPTENPMLWDWNVAYLRYCDGASFTGRNLTVTTHQGKVLNFRGRDILAAVMEDLLPRGLKSATEVVISGCSAGGLATFLHVDQWADMLKERCDSPPKVRGMPDSGFFLDYEGPPQYRSQLQWVYQQQNSTAGILSSCYEHYKEAGEDWKCIFAQYTAPFIQTPIFPLQSLYDSWQAQFILGNQSDIEAMNMFGGLLKDLVNKHVLSAPKNGIFLDACFHHCIGGLWNQMGVSGVKVNQAFEDWYVNGSTLPNKGDFEQDNSYPCDACCSASLADKEMGLVHMYI